MTSGKDCVGCPKDEWPVWKKLIVGLATIMLGGGVFLDSYGRASEAEKVNMLQEQRIAAIERVLTKLPETLQSISQTVNDIDRKIDVHIAQSQPR